MSINPPSRYNLICSYVDSIFDGIVDSKEKRAATVHSFGVAQCCALLAKKRGLNAELASIIGLLHDLYAYKTGHIPLHSINGSEMIRVTFKYSLNGVFTNEEQILIKSAIYHHSDKDLLHDEYDELLKDSDILQHYLFDTTSDEYTGARLKNVAKELGISVPTAKAAHALDSQPHLFDRVLLGNIAESLAKKHIKGGRSDTDYMNIIRYFPEETAFDELKNAWCAAFVFHCCMKARLLLPIRTPHTAKEVANYRFACVLS
ncbi:MAG TPA: hypothetical protein DDZ89_12575, partial [Clostridiales bacterium]|nr:hypothetical protein [Clostridiales bacterium]